MVREVSIAAVAALTLAVVGLACSGPSPAEIDPSSPAAQGTATRRAAVVEVQRIIAGNPTATPLPPSTPTPQPSCSNAIWWTDARSHIGETRLVQGTIVATRAVPGGSALLEIGQPYPDPIGITAVVPSATVANLNGKTVCLPGRIALAEGRPTLQVRDAAGIVVLN